MENSQKLTEGLPVAQKFDGRSPACTKLDGNWLKVFWSHNILTESNRRSTGRTESYQKLMVGLPAIRKVHGSWQKVSWSHTKFFGGLLAALKFQGYRQKVSRQHGKLTEVHGRSHDSTESCGDRQKVYQLHRKLMDSFSAARKVDGMWQKFSWLHRIDEN